MQILSCLHYSSPNESKFLIQLPVGVPKPSSAYWPSEIDTRPRVKADHSFHVYSWYTAIESLRWHVGEIYMEALELRKDWEGRAVQLQKKLHGLASIKDRVTLLFNFLNEESSIKGYRTALSPILKDLRKDLNLEENEAYASLSRRAFQCHCLKYGLQRSDWTPSQTTEKLKEILESKGPLLIFAQLGPSFYLDEAQEQKSAFLGKKFSIWPRGSERSSLVEAQAVIIVGVWSTAKGNMVCFVNPPESTDPSEERKLYIVTYDKFASSIIPIENTYGYTSENVKLVKKPFDT
jgi:hypothetical protein